MATLLSKLDLSTRNIDYIGETHTDLVAQAKLTGIRSLLDKVTRRVSGHLTPNPLAQGGGDPLSREQWAVIQPFQAHVKQDEPSRWLRAIAIKS